MTKLQGKKQPANKAPAQHGKEIFALRKQNVGAYQNGSKLASRGKLFSALHQLFYGGPGRLEFFAAREQLCC